MEQQKQLQSLSNEYQTLQNGVSKMTICNYSQ